MLLAQAGGERRAEIAGRYRRGRYRSGRGYHRAAIEDFQAALALSDSTGVAEYRARLHFEMGAAYEAVGSRRQAHAAYEQAYADIGPVPSTTQRAQLQTRSAEGMARTQTRSYLLWAIVVTILFLLSIGLNVYLAYRLRRRKPPTPEPTSPTPSDAFRRRYTYAYDAFTRPAYVASIIDDPVLETYLRKSGIQQKGELYDVVIAQVAALESKTIDRSTVRKMFTREFTERWGGWPESVEALRAHFLAHPPETL